jgi:hypothetical protein
MWAPSFVLVFDDYDNSGIAQTVSAARAKLRAGGIAFRDFLVHGIKPTPCSSHPNLPTLPRSDFAAPALQAV